jgi:hypothetical protein
MIDNHNIYDIMITQSYRITLESSGLCVTKSPNCRLENSVNPFGRRRKRNIDKTNATQVCDEYMKQAYKTAKDFLGNTGSSMAEHARAACIKDVSVTGNPLVSIVFPIYLHFIIMIIVGTKCNQLCSHGCFETI